MKTIVGLFGNQEDAGRVVEMLVEKDLDKDLKVLHNGGVIGEYPQLSSEKRGDQKR